MTNKIIDFENIDEKLKATVENEDWKKLVQKFKKCKKIYLVANGGLHFTAAHAATDCSRLIDGKVVHSFDSNGFITSVSNDYGYENIFIKWLEACVVDDPKECLVIGMSCSGNSKNVTRCLSWATSKNMNTHMISGRASRRLDTSIDEVDLNCKYFHTVEVLCLVLFYQMIKEMGHDCPTIMKEVERKDPWLV